MAKYSLLTFVLLLFNLIGGSHAQETIIFEQVKYFDGYSSTLRGPANVVVQNGKIFAISDKPVDGMYGSAVKKINGGGSTLIPGLIDVHVHLVFGTFTIPALLDSVASLEQVYAAAAVGAEKMLLRGFTSVRDVGGPIFPLKAGIDAGKWRGPRIWPSGPPISQTAGHGDFRLPNERSRRFFGKPSKAELAGATIIADGRDEVLTAARENLRMGASQLKVMAGGGTSSAYDPVDVTQYTLDELKAAVEAAEDWGTYVTVHAYTNRAVQRAIEAGVKCIEHGQLLDATTLQMMADKGVWLSSQNLIDSTPKMDSLRKVKRKPVIEGQKTLWPLAKKLGVKMAWGTDFLFEPELNLLQNQYMLKLLPWFEPWEILKMVTHDNAELLVMSGLRSPYQGKLGVIEEGALADLILIKGNPLQNMQLLTDPDNNFTIIMKGGEMVKQATGK